MNETVSVVIPCTTPDEHWFDLIDRAKQSIEGADEIIVSTADNLAECRNYGARISKMSHLVFLDADDELGPGYIKAMKAATEGIRRPSTLGVYEDGTEDDEPVMIPRRKISESNYIVIGAMVEREQFLRVGGFRDLPILEDWDLWLRMIRDGAQVVDVPEACYKVHIRPNSRNASEHLHGQIYSEIRRTYRDVDYLHAGP